MLIGKICSDNLIFIYESALENELPIRQNLVELLIIKIKDGANETLFKT